MRLKSGVVATFLPALGFAGNASADETFCNAYADEAVFNATMMANSNSAVAVRSGPPSRAASFIRNTGKWSDMELAQMQPRRKCDVGSVDGGVRAHTVACLYDRGIGLGPQIDWTSNRSRLRQAGRRLQEFRYYLVIAYKLYGMQERLQLRQ